MYDFDDEILKKRDEDKEEQWKEKGEKETGTETEEIMEQRQEEAVFAEQEMERQEELYAERNSEEEISAEQEMEELEEGLSAERTEEEASAEQNAEELKYKEEYDGPRVREYHYEEQVKKAPKKKKGWAKFIAGCLIVSIVGGSSIGVGYGLTTYFLRTRTSGTSAPAVIESTSGIKGGYSASDIVKAVKPSVVSVSTKMTGVAQYFGPFSMPYETSGAGSGVIFYSDDSRVAIATNNHVVEDASSIYVTFEGDISVPAKVIGTKSDSDLAVLTVSWSDLKEKGIDHVTTAVFGDSDAMEVGDSVIAIGNAMGLGLSATDGIISMREQTIHVDGNALSVLQTSAAINSGNSGGALVNGAGEVIGINTAKYNSTMAEGMGYAIPSNAIKPIVGELLETGTMPKPYIGVMGTSITSETAPLYKLPVGALIMEVVEGGPAEKAGIQVGDIITQYDGATVMDMDALVELVNQTEIGKTITIHVVRDGQTGLDLNVKIEDKNG